MLAVMTKPDISTAMTDAEADELYRLAEGKVVIEFGALLGFSTIVMAQSADVVYSVDPHYGYPLAAPRPTLAPFLANLEKYGVRDRVIPILGTGEAISPILRDGSVDLVFIDITRAVEFLLWQASDYMKPSVIAVHDYGIAEWDGATRAVDRYSAETGRKFKLVDTLAIFNL